EANEATDGTLGPVCEACHAPVAIMGGLVGVDPAKMPPQASRGIVCAFCHQVSGTSEPLGNVSQIVEADRVFRAQYDDAKSPYHETAYSAFHQSAEFCGSCHNVDHPGDPNLHLEATYTEWENSPYAKEGIVCQDCHMTPGPGVTKPYPGTAAAGGPQRDHIYLMTFVGGNVGLGDSVLAEERLKAAATLGVSAPEVVANGEKAMIEVMLTNSGAGHYLPTGLTEVRQMWLVVEAHDDAGGVEEIGRHVFGTTLQDAEGNSPVELWDATAIATDDRIPPKESVTDTFEVTMPEGSEVELVATLYYRSCSEEMAEKADVEIPTTKMASVRQTIYSSAEARAKGPSGNGEPGSSVLIAITVIGLALVALGLLLALVRGRATHGGKAS
ncbi:MAG: hypothetical protein OEV43_06235, partial [Coriobacteriia bacterium]|nr:hypothetical protein [Coriobacteriia bacterium]